VPRHSRLTAVVRSRDPRYTKVLTELKSRLEIGPETRMRAFFLPETKSQSASFFLALSMTQSVQLEIRRLDRKLSAFHGICGCHDIANTRAYAGWRQRSSPPTLRSGSRRQYFPQLDEEDIRDEEVDPIRG